MFADIAWNGAHLKYAHCNDENKTLSLSRSTAIWIEILQVK